MHRLLNRQIKKSGLLDGDISQLKLDCLYELVAQAYLDNDEDRILQENILETSSREMNALYESLKQSAETDILTGVLNKQQFEKKLSEIILVNKKENRNLAICFLDLDHFKQINDSLGHNIGDCLLKLLTEKIGYLLNENDLFARIGGDEFIIVFNNLHEDPDIKNRIEHVMSIIRQPWKLGKHEIIITASLGVSFYPFDDTSLVGLMKKADLAMYKAKSIGRDNFVFYTETLNNVNKGILFLEQSMPKALKNREFELYLQPILSTKDNKIVGAESLIRWNNPSEGLIFPDRFINLAENTGFINRLGQWVIYEACMMIKRIQPQNKDFRLSVNVSIRQFQHGNIFKTIINALYSTNIDPKHLSIEITESIMGDNTENVIAKINEIKSLGINVYLDDFGTGFSSLSYLSQLNIDVIKIDKVFLDELTEGKPNLLDTIISMGHSLNKSVIAEGVENESQIQYLLDKGCEYYQGYYFSKAVTEDDFLELLETNQVISNQVIQTNQAIA